MLFIKQKYKQQFCFLAHRGGWFSKISNTRQPIRNTHTHINKEWTNEGAGLRTQNLYLTRERGSERSQSQVQKSSRKCKLLEMCCLSPLEVNTKSLSGRHIVIDKELCKAGKKKSVTLGVKTLCRIFYHLHVYLMSISPLRVCDWTNKQSRSLSV